MNVEPLKSCLKYFHTVDPDSFGLWAQVVFEAAMNLDVLWTETPSAFSGDMRKYVYERLDRNNRSPLGENFATKYQVDMFNNGMAFSSPTQPV